MLSDIKYLLIQLKKLLLDEKFLTISVFFPSILIFLIFIPYNMVTKKSPGRTVIGVVELDSVSIFDILEKNYYQKLLETNSGENIRLIRLLPDREMVLDSLDSVLALNIQQLDSLGSELEQLREYRERLFLDKKIRASLKKKQLESAFTRIQLLRKEYQRQDSICKQIRLERNRLYSIRILRKAESMLKNRAIDSYIVFSDSSIARGIVEYHSYYAGAFLQSEWLDQAIWESLINLRLTRMRIPLPNIAELMKPIVKKEFWVLKQRKEHFQILSGYVLPVFLSILLILSLIMSTEQLLDQLMRDKMINSYELFFFRRSYWSWLFHRVFASLLVGLIQFSLWLGMVFVADYLRIIDLSPIGIFEAERLGQLAVEYVNSYVFLAFLYLFLYPFLEPSQGRHHFVMLLMRLMLFMPVIFAFLFIRQLYPFLNTFFLHIPLYQSILHIILVEPTAHPVDQLLRWNGMLNGVFMTLVIIWIWKMHTSRFGWHLHTFGIREIFGRMIIKPQFLVRMKDRFAGKSAGSSEQK